MDGKGGSLQLITIFKGGTLPDSSSTRHQLDTFLDIHIVEHLPGLNVMVLSTSILILCRLGIYGKGNGRPRRRCGRSDIEKILRAFNSIQLKYPISS